MRKTIVVLLMAALILCFAMPTLGAGEKNLMLTLMGTGNYKDFTAAAGTTHLDSSLYTGGPYTILAPTDAAFNKLPAVPLKSLLDNRPELTGVFKNHIVTGKYTTDDLVRMGTVSTLDGKRLSVTRASDGSVIIGGAKIVNPNVQASNGIIQGIDGVLLPK